VDWDVWPVLTEDVTTVGLAFYELNRLKATYYGFSGIAEAANTAEQV
jgi:hypothetical protein